MHEFWTIATINMTYTRSPNYTIVVGTYGLLIFKVVIVVLLLMLLFDVFIPTSAHPFIFLN